MIENFVYISLLIGKVLIEGRVTSMRFECKKPKFKLI